MGVDIAFAAEDACRFASIARLSTSKARPTNRENGTWKAC